MTFAVLILVSNLMGLFRCSCHQTAATSVTFALGISSFLYYNWIGIKENGSWPPQNICGAAIWLDWTTNLPNRTDQ